MTKWRRIKDDTASRQTTPAPPQQPAAAGSDHSTTEDMLVPNAHLVGLYLQIFATGGSGGKLGWDGTQLTPSLSPLHSGVRGVPPAVRVHPAQESEGRPLAMAPRRVSRHARHHSSSAFRLPPSPGAL